MIIVMKRGFKQDDLNEVVKFTESQGYTVHLIEGVAKTVVAAVGDGLDREVLRPLAAYNGVEKLLPVMAPYKLANREVKEDPTVVRLGEATLGGKEICVIAGPCSIESEKQIIEAAIAVRDRGARILRGGAYKPRTSPYSFQGLEQEGLKLLRKASEESGLPVVTEITDPHDVDLIGEYTDMFQVGARNVQNFALLKRLGRAGKPVLLKRGLSTTINEFLQAAEYLLSEGNRDVVLCERGIRTFETATRFTLDINAVPVLKDKTHLPVIVDPSHATGKRDYVPAVSYAGVAAGADGLIVEVHPEPQHAMSDPAQQLTYEGFSELMTRLARFAEAADRTLTLDEKKLSATA